MKVLITGGAGFIGANLARMLIRRGIDVVIYDSLVSGRREYIPEEAKFVHADLCDTQALLSVMPGIDCIVHLAASGSVVDSVEDPKSNFGANVLGTFQLLEASRDIKLKKFVFASTGGALIGNATPPVNEDSLPKPISPYGAGKLCGEAYCHAFAISYGMPTVSLRFANVYGPYSAHKKGVITQYIKNIQNGKALIIYGDGTSTRDYIHVEDLCRGIASALDVDVKPGEVFHLASGYETSIVQLATTISTIFGFDDYPIMYEKLRRGEIDRNFARYDKAATMLGFDPAWTLEAGLKSTIDWFKNYNG